MRIDNPYVSHAGCAVEMNDQPNPGGANGDIPKKFATAEEYRTALGNSREILLNNLMLAIQTAPAPCSAIDVLGVMHMALLNLENSILAQNHAMQQNKAEGKSAGGIIITR